MAELLYIQASPRGDRSFSLTIANAFVEAYRKIHPEDAITPLNLFDSTLPEFSGNLINTKYAILHGKNPSAEDQAAWRTVEKIISQFTSADKYVFAVPMWNFGIPYRLKQYIDILLQPTYTFNVTEKGYQGLVTGKPVFIAYARGGSYPPGTPAESLDFQKIYLETILGFIGLTDIHTLVMENALGGERAEAYARRDALANEARKMAEEFHTAGIL